MMPYKTMSRQRASAWWTAAVALALASPLVAQATPSISPQRYDERRDVVSLREYIDVRLRSLEDKLDARDIDRQLAIDKAEQSINKRLEGVPETFVPKVEYASRTDDVDRRLAAIENRLASFDGSLKIGWLLFLVLQIALGAWLRRRIEMNGRPK